MTAKVPRSRNFCITLTDEHMESLVNLESLAETKDPDFAKFHYNNKDFEVFIGPVEDPDNECKNPHRHVGIRCVQQTMTKTAASEAMEAYLKLTRGRLYESYCRPLDSNWRNYITYARKSQYVHKDDEHIKSAAEKLRSLGAQINRSNMKRKLVEQHGYTYYNKHLKTNLDTFLDTDGQVDPRGQMETPVDPEKNALLFFETFKIFQSVIAKGLLRNGYHCSWKEREYTKNFELEDFQLMIEFLALAPTALYRSKEHVDNLPGLFLFGLKNTGKSTFFVSNPHFKKVPTDADGVSRYKLEGGQTGLLLDDVHPKLFMGGKDGPTLKQVALGAPATVKTCGSTSDTTSWLVCTSNHPPPFMSAEPPADTDEQVVQHWSHECDAWKRRFILICLGDYVDNDPIIVKWSDYNIRDRAADLLHAILERIKERQPKVYEAYLKYYHTVLFKDYSLSCEQPKLLYQFVDYERVKMEMQEADFIHGAPHMMMTAPPRVFGRAQGEAPPVTNSQIMPQELKWSCSHSDPVPYNDWCQLCESAWQIRCEGLVPPHLVKVCEAHSKRGCDVCFSLDAQDVIDCVNALKYYK